MRRTTTLMTATLTASAAVLALAGPVTADDAPRWQRVPDQPPLVMEGCGATITFDEEVNRVRELVTETEEGLRILVKGKLLIRATTDDGRTGLLDASGPADIRLADGVGNVVLRGMSLLIATDEMVREAHEEAGLPELALVKGRVQIRDVFDEESGELISTEFVSLPRPGRRIVDVCTLLEDEDG